MDGNILRCREQADHVSAATELDAQATATAPHSHTTRVLLLAAPDALQQDALSEACLLVHYRLLSCRCF